MGVHRHPEHRVDYMEWAPGLTLCLIPYTSGQHDSYMVIILILLFCLLLISWKPGSFRFFFNNLDGFTRLPNYFAK